MSDTTVLNVKIDKQLKKQAQDVAATIGLPMSTIVATGLREFVRSRSITVSDYPRIKPEVEAELLRLSKDAKAGKNLSPSFDNATDAITWLKKEVKKDHKK